MSDSESKDIQKVVIKTEPLDNCGQENDQNVFPLTNKSAFIGSDDQKDGCDKVFDNSSELPVRKIKRSNSSSDDLCAVLDNSGKEFQDVEKSGFYEETVSHSQTSESVQNAEDQKPSTEELEIYSKNPSKLYLAQPPCKNKTISTLTHDSALNDGCPDQVRLGDCTSGTYDLNLMTPVVKLSRLSHSQLLLNASNYRHILHVMKEKYPNKRILDSEIMKPVLSKDGIIIYQCQGCKKVFNKRQTLRQHFITHTDRFACPYCDGRSKSKGDLDMHIQTHTKEKPFHCDTCNTSYTRESILKKHMKTRLHLRATYEHENLAQLRTVKKSRKKNEHIIVTTHTKTFNCILCRKVTFSKAEYKKHARSHIFKYMCNICQKGCKSNLHLSIHKRSHNRPTNLSCQLCVRSFANFYCLKEHAKSHKYHSSGRQHDEDLNRASCSKSNKDIAEKDSSLNVKNVSPVAMELECDDCHKTFFSKRQLINHGCGHKETYICGMCMKTFSSLAKLKIHLKLHERVLKCEICDLIFFKDKELEDHLNKLHGMKKRHTCSICYDHFYSASNLKHHMKYHAPTMLFSGRSLNESTVPVVKSLKRKSSRSVVDTMQVTKAEDCDGIKGVTEKVETLKSSDSDDDSILDSQEFYEILNSALDGSDDNLNDSEISDSDEELYSHIKTVLENKVMMSGESERNASEEICFLKKPLIYEREDIMKKHLTEFERCSEVDEKNQAFKCKLCDRLFHEEKYLKNHLKHHVCEHCNTFFGDKEKLAAHKSHHIRQLLKHMKNEALRLHIPKQKWKGYLMSSSESESELEDKMPDKTNNAPRKDSLQPVNAVNIQHTLSHNEIVQANKHLFEHYSCLDQDNNLFACILCKKQYARTSTLTRHLKTHVCKLCNKFFKDKSDLLEHKYSHRKKAAPLNANTGEDSKMPSTIVSKPNRKLFKRYSFIDANRHVFRCTLCQKAFVRKTVLTRHLKTHICAHCDQFFEDKYDLVKHQMEKHCLPDSSAVEDELTNSGAVKNELPEINAVTGAIKDEFTIKCAVKDEFTNIVSDEFPKYAENKKRISSKSSHVENINNEVKNIELLSECTLLQPQIKPSPQMQSLCNGIKDTITFIQIPCTEISKTVNNQVFSVPSSGTPSFQIACQPVQVYKNIAQAPFLVPSTSSESNKIITVPQVQIKSTHPAERERPFECGHCGKRFLKNDHLKSHLTIHTGDRPFICSLCGKAFGRSTILQKHMKTHMKQCKVCETSFTSKYELDLHMEVHRSYTVYK